jgi:quinol monooxygenase YgiN
MTTPTDDDPNLLTVIASMKAAPGNVDELRSALTSLVEPTLQEEGCVNYDLHESVEEPGVFFFYENWDSAEHLDAHLSAPHLAEFADKIGDLLDESGLSINRLRRIA